MTPDTSMMMETRLREKLTGMEYHCRECNKIKKDIFSFLDTLDSSPYVGSKILRLERHSDGIRGIFIFKGLMRWYTLEHPVKHIPLGVYNCKRRWSTKFDCELYEIESVAGRSDIEIHWGNTLEDTTGCVLLGTALGKLMGKTAVTNSKVAFGQFMRLTHLALEFHVAVMEI